MAALGKIRKRGVILVIVIGLGLFAFIAEELFRSCETTRNERYQQVGEVLGTKVSLQQFQDMLEEYELVIKVMQNRDNLTEDELNRVKDQVWNSYVSNAIIEAEAKKLGLTVTDEEMQDMLRAGTNSLLRQTPFVNSQTGRFDVTLLTKFLEDYKSMKKNPQSAQLLEQYENLDRYWNFIEKQLRQQTLAEKYQALLSSCLISNPVSAKQSFADQNVESSAEIASLAYSTINDNDVTVEDAELRKMYEARKEMYRQVAETRDIKYVDFQVKASAADRVALMKTMKDAADSLAKGADPATTVHKAQSDVAFIGVPVRAKALPSDIRTKIDSMKVGETCAPFETKRDNSLNVVKLIAKTQLPDSISYRQISVGGSTLEEVRQRADSIYKALKAGANFNTLAEKYSSKGDTIWLTSAMYENAQQALDADMKLYITTLASASPNEIKNIEMTQGNAIVQLVSRKAMTDKYMVAVVKRTIDFSKKTYSDAYNKFSQYVSENQTIDDLEKNAKNYGFTVKVRKDVSNAEHYVANVRATREAMKWIFDAKTGDVSPLYECGENDHLMVVALTGVHPVGYRDFESVSDMLKEEALRDKKYEMAKEKLAGVSDIKAAESKGAKVSTVEQITFAAPVFVKASGASEPALSGAVAATKQGETCPRVIKGNRAAYMLKVSSKAEREGQQYDEKAAEERLAKQAVQAASRFMQELYADAKVVDRRYLFF